jgi:hypothetical protein
MIVRRESSPVLSQLWDMADLPENEGASIDSREHSSGGGRVASLKFGVPPSTCPAERTRRSPEDEAFLGNTYHDIPVIVPAIRQYWMA